MTTINIMTLIDKLNVEYLSPAQSKLLLKTAYYKKCLSICITNPDTESTQIESALIKVDSNSLPLLNTHLNLFQAETAQLTLSNGDGGQTPSEKLSFKEFQSYLDIIKTQNKEPSIILYY